MSMVHEIDAQIDYAVQNPHEETHRCLLSFAALDLGLGHVLRDRRRDPSWFQHDARHAVNAAIPQTGTCALLDTTTLLNAYRILHPDIEVKSVPPGAIFDLATFVSACLFEDNLVFLENPGVSSTEVTKLLEGLSVVSLAWEDDSDLGIIVEHTWAEAERYTPGLFNDRTLREGFVKHWSSLIGKDVGLNVASWPADYRQYFSSVDAYAVQSAIVGTDQDENIMYSSIDDDFLHEFITQSSIRVLFYSLLSNALNVTYYASSFRSRLREMVYQYTEHSVVTDTQALFKSLNDVFHEDIAKDEFVVPDIVMPFALSAALMGVTSCAELCEHIAELREAVTPLRKKRNELATAWRNHDQAAVRALVKAVTEDAKLIADHTFFAGHGITSQLILSSGGARTALGALGKLLLCFSGLPDDVKELLRQRCVRPELWVVARLSAQARRVINCVDPVNDLLKRKGKLLDADKPEREWQLKMLQRLTAV